MRSLGANNPNVPRPNPQLTLCNVLTAVVMAISVCHSDPLPAAHNWRKTGAAIGVDRNGTLRGFCGRGRTYVTCRVSWLPLLWFYSDCLTVCQSLCTLGNFFLVGISNLFFSRPLSVLSFCAHIACTSDGA